MVNSQPAHREVNIQGKFQLLMDTLLKLKGAPDVYATRARGELSASGSWCQSHAGPVENSELMISQRYLLVQMPLEAGSGELSIGMCWGWRFWYKSVVQG